MSLRTNLINASRSRIKTLNKRLFTINTDQSLTLDEKLIQSREVLDDIFRYTKYIELISEENEEYGKD